MQIDPTSAAIGAGIILGVAVIFGISLTFLTYYFRLVREAKKKSVARDHRKDLKTLRKALAEMGYAHLGYLALSVTLVLVGMKTGATVADSRFFVIAGMALLTWYILVPGFGVLRLRDMLTDLQTPSETAATVAEPALAPAAVLSQPAAPATPVAAALPQVDRLPRPARRPPVRRQTRAPLVAKT